MKIRTFLFLFLSFTLTMCKKDHMLDCFKSAGKTVTDERTATPFTKIDLKDNVELIIHPNSTFYIKVTAGENLIDGIITELSGTTLYIRNENRCNWARSFSNKYSVEIGMDKPEVIEYSGSGNISCLDTIHSNDFSFECRNGSGSIFLLLNCNNSHLNNHIGRSDIHASGFSDQFNTYINDVGTLDASSLLTNTSYIRSSTTGDCKLNVRNELGYEIKYTGNIYYSGNPHLTEVIYTGDGKLIHF